MLRPDFTVPLVRLHMERGLDAGAYVYCGPVWRRQDAVSSRAREYLQAGLEIFGGADAAATDAEVLARILAAMDGAPVDVVVGDMGLSIAVIDALPASAARKAALRRHLWRPRRFRALLHRFGEGHAEATAARADLIAALKEGRAGTLIAGSGAPVGLRTSDEVVERLELLAAEAADGPLDPEAAAGIEATMAVAGPAPEALERLEGLAERTPGLGPAAAQLRARLAALEARGIDPAKLRFEASFGRTTLEYYDGFVFGAVARDRPDLPQIASGGRYDALTRVLGEGRDVAAVGGVVRPEALAALRARP